MIERLRKQPTSRINVEKAITVLNDETISFSEKLKQIQTLEDLSTGFELEMFSEIYSSLHDMAENDDDIKLISGA